MRKKRSGKKKAEKASERAGRAPIRHWSHSSLMAFLRNSLAWYKRYVEEVYDTPRTPSSAVGSAAHAALEHFYSGFDKDAAVRRGLDYLRGIADFEIDFGTAKTRKAKREKRAVMEREYLQAVGFYLAKPPKHKVLGVEVVGVASVPGIALPLKAVSDLVVESKVEPGAVDIVDHKFVASWSKRGAEKTLFVIQALFNYYTVREIFGRKVRRFIVYECKKTRNTDGSPQLRRYDIDFDEYGEEFELFRRLVNDATVEITRPRLYLPNPSDMFEGENSFDIYRLGL